MASDTSASSDTGGPGPSIHFEEAGYESKHKPEAPFSSLSSSAKKEMEYLRRELEDSRQRINRDTEVINSLHEKVTALEELVSKQKITISTQSKTISDRRVLRKSQQQQFPMTPNHHHPHVQQYPVSGRNASGIPGAGGASVGGEVNVMHQAPSPFETQTPQSVTSFGSTSQYSTVFDQPPPKFEIPYGVSVQAYNAVVPPSLGRTQDVFGPMAIAVSNGADHGSSTLSVPDNDYRKEMADFSTRFLGLMRLAEIFGQAHASFPNIFMDSHLDGQVKEYLMAISSRSQASVLIGNATTRGFFVAKAINYYLVNNVLTIAVVKGFDLSADLEIGQIEEQLNSHVPASVRHLMLTAITTQTRTLSKKPGFAEFSQRKIQNHLQKLWKLVGPLSHDPYSQNGKMWTDLNQIVTDAQSLATDMYSVPLEYKFDYPESGEPFDPSTMINRDPYIHGDPHILKNGDTRVRLGITPIVRIRNNSQSPGEVNLMYLSHVLLKVPKKQAP